MIYVTGDCHGDYRRFNSDYFQDMSSLNKDNYVIICGDFGLWDESAERQRDLDLLNDLPFTTLWVDGNHENYDLLKKYEVKKWKGGKVQYIRSSIIHLLRGQVFEIEGKKFFTFGGASSHDVNGGIFSKDDPHLKQRMMIAYMRGLPFRIEHLSWWKEELPSEEEMQEGLDNLKKHHDEVNYIITHCTASSIQAVLSKGMYKVDRLTDYLETLKQTLTYDHWYFGHYHEDLEVSDKETLLYYKIRRII